ncbi:MAG: efflux RND transporter periplasmic adaptor subunit [Minisyncoccia bacterium]
MKNIYSKSKHFIVKYKWWSVIILTLILVASYYVWSSFENVNYQLIEVVKTNLSEEVSITGRVKAIQNIDLAFEKSGTVGSIKVNVGDKVVTGQPLVSLTNSDLLAQYDQTLAALQKEEVRLSELKRGTRLEEITLQETQVEKSSLDLAQAKTNLINTLKDSYTKADDALKNKIYSLFTDPAKYGAGLTFSTDSFLQEDIEDGKDTISDDLYAWYKELSELNTTSDLEIYYSAAKLNMTSIKSLLDKCATAVNGLNADSNISQTQIDTWKSNISTARTNIDLAISSLTTSYDTYKTSVSALKISQDQLAIKKAGSSAEEIYGQEAQLAQARANVGVTLAQLNKNTLYAPFSGLVAKQEVKIGQIVSPGEMVVSIISSGQYEIEAFIPEADIAKVALGNEAVVTLDAYGSNVKFTATIFQIDPTETLTEGVATYKTIIRFNNEDTRIKSGMTANIDILTASRKNVLAIPMRYLISKDGVKLVKVLDQNDPSDFIEKEIEVGLKGSDGNIEVISGLEEGARIIIPTI